MFFMGLNIVPGLLCTLKPKNIKKSSNKTAKPCSSLSTTRG